MTAVWCQVNLKAATFLGILTVVIGDMSFASGVWPSTETDDGLQIEITRKGAGKQVVLSQGVKEWFMLIEVTPENAVILKQEKEQDRYLIDESETHDRPMTVDEVDAAITDYVNSVKARVRKK
ncbi:conserved hypothetical protein [Candidatus Nitrospira nitrosa]|uniref:Uncharacterized protein n=1 Tax=Candidatus Nitrospira nitrosa TaxID=1742972 RepID=A0A0S4LGA9_9BACT|nr:conserved hypothetical protein [Candidatus Nitrospira nitrosa]